MNINWMLAGKVAMAALVASGLIGTGYVAAPKEPAAVKECVEKVIFRPKIYINGQEVKQR
ncbi:MAG TPA: hypothetical protein VJ742_08525 [Nitrososphaera sp.]|nr:hypothetical protein [Nitrososphaera sp.]